MSERTQCQDSLLSHTHYISLQLDDDYLNLAGQGTDRYYTGGIAVHYSFAPASRPGILPALLFMPRHPASSLYRIGLTQRLYTPADLRLPGPVEGDYPYCAALFADLSREAMAGHRQLFRSELRLGVQGPLALGGPVQSFIHRFSRNEDPNGWSSQLPNYPVINYDLYGERGLLSAGRHIAVNGLANVQLGSSADNARIGLNIVVCTQKDDYFPSHSGMLHLRGGKAQKKAYLQLIPSVKLVAYNSTLQAGFFGPKDYYHIAAPDINRVVLLGTAVIGLRIWRLVFEYRQVLQSREFHTVQPHIYGSLVLTQHI